MSPLSAVLGHWISDLRGATIQPVVRAGYSGARVWKVDYRGQAFALRRWPRAVTADRVIGIHQFQDWLAHGGVPVPRTVGAMATGQSVLRQDDAQWELATWMPGEAIYHAHPHPERLVAAMQSLARLHLRAAKLPIDLPRSDAGPRPSPGLVRRSERLCNLVLKDLRQLRTAVYGHPSRRQEQLAERALALLERAADAELQKSKRWEDQPLPLHLCLRDVWHDHILFSDHRVTGIVDLGAIGYDSPAGDVARLLGSLVGDDCQRWADGLSAYEAVRPLSDVEREAVGFFDSSGVVISTANWLRWLHGPAQTRLPPESFDRDAAFQRFGMLVGRLEHLAAAGM
jgi:Ser/Thr protein kinase RdoA (MazF antagonist)